MHFRALATALIDVRPPVDHSERAGWLRCVNAVADVCATTNINFDRAKFIEACGATEAGRVNV